MPYYTEDEYPREKPEEAALPYVERPCYYQLRALAAWQPKEAHWLFHLYDMLGFVLLTIVTGATLYLPFVHHRDVQWPEGINSLSTVITDLCGPFMLIKYYTHSIFESVQDRIQKQDNAFRRDCAKRAKVCSFLCFGAWILSSLYFYYHWKVFFKKDWHYFLYVLVIVYGRGWCAAWLSIYGYVCIVHKLEVNKLRDVLVSSSSDGLKPEKLLRMFNDLAGILEKSQNHFNFIISLAVGCNIVDTVIFSVAYFRGDFDNENGRAYAFILYAGGITIDALSIFAKLFPAALVCEALNQLTIASSKLCVPVDDEEIEAKLFILHEYIHVCVQSLGFRILGVKITMQVALTLLVTVVSLVLALLKYTI